MPLDDAALGRMFPSDNVPTWNEGTWPPQILRKRWQELFVTCLASVLQHDPGRVSGHPFYANKVAERAARLADWALRCEVERGL